MNAKQEYINVIKEFIEKTSKSKIVWKKQSPTTLYLEIKSGEGANVVISIQKIQERKRVKVGGRILNKTVESYLFTVRKSITKETIIQMDSNSVSDYNPYLKELFDVASFTIEKKSIDFLRDIMDNL